MHRPQKGNLGVLYNDALLDLRHVGGNVQGNSRNGMGTHMTV